LYCRWCDTAYTWNWLGTDFCHDDPTKYDPVDQIIECDVDEVARRVLEFHCSHVVLTGGEPMLQQRQLVPLTQALRAHGRFHFEVETNGTQIPESEFDAVIDQYNVSPKLGNSGVKVHLRLRDAALSALASNPKAVFKFVVATEPDLLEVDELLERLLLEPSRCYLMPEGTSPEQLSERRPWLIGACLRRGTIFTDRLHVHVWGAKRGV
jgi:organic radical activating enzyme